MLAIYYTYVAPLRSMYCSTWLYGCGCGRAPCTLSQCTGNIIMRLTHALPPSRTRAGKTHYMMSAKCVASGLIVVTNLKLNGLGGRGTEQKCVFVPARKGH